MAILELMPTMAAPVLRPRLRLGLWFAVASTLACATNPVSGKKQVVLISEAQEIAMGRQGDQEVRQEMGVYDDPELQRYVEDIGLELARDSHRPNLPWTFAIVDSPAVNAFALPGGFIFVTRGLLAHLNSEAELAGVLGHEIGHVTARHSAEQYTRAAGAGIGMTIAQIFFPVTRPFGDVASLGVGTWFLKYGRDDELEADRLGAEYAARGGWDPDGVAAMLRTLSRLDAVNSTDRRGVPGWLSTHPNPGDRVEKVSASVEKSRALLGDGAGAARRDEYLRRIDGLPFGEDPREGVVRGHDFLHADLRFAISFPEGWEIVNGAKQVLAREPGTKHMMLLDLTQDQTARSLEDLARRSMSGAGFKFVSGASEQINGLEAWVGTFDGKVTDVGLVMARATFVAHGRNVFRLLGFAPRDAFPLIARDVQESQRTFRALSREEAREIRPNEVDLYTVRAGDTWQSIAQRTGRGTVNAATLAIINGYEPAEQPQPGDLIKVVIEG
jgi:predicted Zn-dependent protease